MMPVRDGGSLYARGKPTRLALDHITVVDATPLQLADIAFEAGFRAISPFLYSLDVMCQMF
jgi:hypothetical protein